MIRMSAGQLASWSPPTEVRSSPVSSTTPASSEVAGSPSRIQHVVPVGVGELADRGAGRGRRGRTRPSSAPGARVRRSAW